jgi:hypothetical protein
LPSPATRDAQEWSGTPIRNGAIPQAKVVHRSLYRDADFTADRHAHSLFGNHTTLLISTTFYPVGCVENHRSPKQFLLFFLVSLETYLSGKHRRGISNCESLVTDVSAIARAGACSFFRTATDE